MQSQEDPMEEPMMTSASHQYAPSQPPAYMSVIKHGFLAGAILAGIVIITTVIFTTPVVSTALFSTFAISYFFGLLYQ